MKTCPIKLPSSPVTNTILYSIFYREYPIFSFIAKTPSAYRCHMCSTTWCRITHSNLLTHIGNMFISFPKISHYLFVSGYHNMRSNNNNRVEKKVVRFVRREETNIRNFWIKWNGRIHSTHTPWEKDGLENKIERHIHSMPALPWTNKYLFRLCRNPNRRMFRTNLFVQLLCDEESTKKKPQTIS